MTLPVLVINRDVDRDRWDHSLSAALKQGVEPLRLPAIDAHDAAFRARDHADLIGPVFWGHDTIKPGALGCFLSHRAAWTKVIDLDSPAALILEDDADLTEPPDRVADVLASTRCDLLFVNDRMADWVRATGIPGTSVVLDGLIRSLAGSGGPSAHGVRRAPGGDAYAVTRVGARRLLRITEQTKIVCGADWAMIWAALPRGMVVNGIEELKILDATTPRPHRPILAYAMAKPAAALRKGPSVLKHSIEVPIASLLEHE